MSMIYGVTEFRARFTPAAKWHSATGAKRQFGWTDSVITDSQANFTDLDIADFFITFAVWDNNPDFMYSEISMGNRNFKREV